MGNILTAAQAEADRTTFITGLTHVARYLGVTAQEKAAVANIGSTRQTSAEFALSALVNCTVKTPQELHSLTVELARIANEFMFSSVPMFDKLEDLVCMLDTASDLADTMREINTDCRSCSGTGEGSSDAQSCGSCGGKGWKA